MATIKPVCYRSEVRAPDGRFIRYAYLPRPPGEAMFAATQLRTGLVAAIREELSPDYPCACPRDAGIEAAMAAVLRVFE